MKRARVVLFVASVLLLPLVLAGCASGLQTRPRDPETAARTFTVPIQLGAHTLDLHLAAPPHPRAPDVLVLYASGDGGWFGAAVDMFHALGDSGFYTVGLNSRAFLRRASSKNRPLTATEIAADYEAILQRAAAELHLPPARRVVLTGWSRGASLAVIAGGARRRPANLAGIIAIGLAADENLALDRASDDADEEGGIKTSEATLDMYRLLAQVEPGRTAVIQATGDGYLPSARAHRLFGADTALRRFFEVTASNHRFGGNADGFLTSLRAALHWITGATPDTSATPATVPSSGRQP